MDANVRRRARRESLTIGREDVISSPEHHQVVGPSLTRQPHIDAMLHDMAIISQSCLERIRNKVMDGQFLDRDELREFKDICETVLRQTRVEMEVEQHVSQRTSAMSGEQIEVAIKDALLKEGIDTEVTRLVLQALGIQTS